MNFIVGFLDYTTSPPDPIAVWDQAGHRLPVLAYAASGTVFEVQGNVADGGANAGTKPVATGGQYLAVLNSYADGQRFCAWGSSRGRYGTEIYGTNLTPAETSLTALATKGLTLGALNTIGFGFVADQASSVWRPVSGFSTGALDVQVNGSGWTDRSINGLSGASQQLAAANSSRRFLLISNPITATAQAAINPTGGAAVIGGAGCITLNPGDSFGPVKPPTAQINVIGTAGQILCGWEY